MPERPILPLGPLRVERRVGRPRPIPTPRTPPFDQQVNRITPQIQRLEEILSRDGGVLTLQSDPTALAPERAVVFEVSGSLSTFTAQAERVGFMLLGEFETEYDPDENFYYTNDKDERQTDKVEATLYLLMPDERAMQELLRLWARYRDGKSFPRNYRQWKALFDQLRTIRPWGAQDRLTASFVQELREWVSRGEQRPFRFEVNLWFSDSDERRRSSRGNFETVISGAGGQILHESRIEAIKYHGLLAEIPSQFLGEDETQFIQLISHLDPVMHYAPQSMAYSEIIVDEEGELAVGEFDTAGPACAALVDGYPFSNHSLLANRVDIEDIFEIEQLSQSAYRKHGTAMASLILNGELAQTDDVVNNRLLIIPALQPDTFQNNEEFFPPDKLAIDLIYQAVLKIHEKQVSEPATFGKLTIINHSLGNRHEEYCGKVSHWGKLLDYLSFTYGYLFIVSAGNHKHNFALRQFSTLTEYEAATPEEKRNATFRALCEDVQFRQVLSPAESINPIVVGAWHEGAPDIGPPPGRLVDLFPSDDGPSIVSSIGLGHKRSIKPDIFYKSGKAYCSVSTANGCCQVIPSTNSAGGLSVASPGTPGVQTSRARTFGTSCAAALVTNLAIRISNMLDELAETFATANVPQSHRAALIKALLVHGSAWHETGEHLEGITEPLGGKKHFARRTNIARLLGFGRPDIERVIESTSNRATMFAYGTITKDQKQILSIPIPASLSGRADLRRVTITLSWFSPVNTRHAQYRQAVLELEIPDKCGAERKTILQPPALTCNRGTLIHGIFEGTTPITTESFTVEISCKAQAGGLDDAVPFAIAVSFETPIESKIDVYTEIRSRLALEVRERVPV